MTFARTTHRGPWFFDVAGGFTSNRPGLRRTDTLWKALGKAAVLHEAYPDPRFVLLTTDVPTKNGAGHSALAAGPRTGQARPRRDPLGLRRRCRPPREEARGGPDRPRKAR